jgi:hypothetical protein
LKAHQLATVPSLGEDLLDERWFNILVVEFELLFGIWLLFGLLPRLTWLATVGCFAMFASVSAYKTFLGEVSCGCWGTVEIDPKYTLVFDIALLGTLLWARPTGFSLCSRNMWAEGLQLSQKWKSVASVLGLWILMAIPATYAMLSVKTFDVSELGEVFIGVDARKTITLTPEKWANSDFALLDYTDVKDRLSRGVWLVLLHTHTCSSCQESVRLYQDLAVEFAQNEKAPRIAMIELPPYEMEQTAKNPDNPILHGRLDKSHKWKIKSPALLLVDGNNIQNVFDNPLETDLIRAIWGNKK